MALGIFCGGEERYFSFLDTNLHANQIFLSGNSEEVHGPSLVVLRLSPTLVPILYSLYCELICIGLNPLQLLKEGSHLAYHSLGLPTQAEDSGLVWVKISRSQIVVFQGQ